MSVACNDSRMQKSRLKTRCNDMKAMQNGDTERNRSVKIRQEEMESNEAAERE
jgi:hypothetical protein